MQRVLTSARATRRALASAAAAAPPVAAGTSPATGGVGNGTGALEAASLLADAAATEDGRDCFLDGEEAVSSLWAAWAAATCDAGGVDSVVLCGEGARASSASSSNMSSSLAADETHVRVGNGRRRGLFMML